ncbi:hypothetical protein PanWU01x14_230340, partial [Parasponia andersonii]
VCEIESSRVRKIESLRVREIEGLRVYNQGDIHVASQERIRDLPRRPPRENTQVDW